MNSDVRRTENLMWLGLVLTVVLLALAAATAALKWRRTAAPSALPVLAQVKDFTLTNQLGQVVTLASLKGHVWIADIIFTRCAGPCPIMSRNLRGLQHALPPGSDIKLVTLTTDPAFDTPAVMQRYAEKFDADPARWLFLTGTPEQIANLAVDSLKLSAMELKPEQRQSPEDLFIHSTLFVLVDKNGRLRGIFETTGAGVDVKAVQAQIISAAKQLERES